MGTDPQSVSAVAGFVQAVVDGLAEGSLYAMLALGYTLVYGIIKLINFAHGEFYMIGAYAGLFVLASPFAATTSPALFALALLLALGAAVGAGAAIAVVCERVAYKPIRRYERIVALLTAIGVSFLLQNLARLAFSPNPRTYGAAGRSPEACLTRFLDWYRRYTTLPLPGVEIEIHNAKALILVVGLATLGFLYVLVMKTRFGKAMRATSQDLEAARLMGVNADAVVAKTFALGGAFAGLAGLLMGMLLIVQPMMGFMPGLKAFAAAVVGGIGSIPGAALGGLLIGLAESLAVWAGFDTAYKDAVAFGLLVLVLLVRPSGLLGVKRREKV